MRSRDASALDHLTRCYAGRLLAAGRRHCRTVEEAQDAVQDAWVTAAENLPAFRGEGSIEGWLVRIVASACARLRRGTKNNAAVFDHDVELEAEGSSPEIDTGQREIRALLEAQLLVLKAEDRQILLLSEVEGWTGAEVARELGLSEGAVRTRLSRIRAQMLRELGPLRAQSTDRV